MGIYSSSAFLPGESHGLKILEAIVCGFAELEMTERLTIHFALTYQSGSYYHLCFSDGKIEIQNGESACHHIQLLNCIFRIQT